MKTIPLTINMAILRIGENCNNFTAADEKRYKNLCMELQGIREALDKDRDTTISGLRDALSDRLREVWDLKTPNIYLVEKLLALVYLDMIINFSALFGGFNEYTKEWLTLFLDQKDEPAAQKLTELSTLINEIFANRDWVTAHENAHQRFISNITGFPLKD